MQNEKHIYSFWLPEERLLYTRLSGDINSNDVDQWQSSLREAIQRIPDNSSIKVMVDIYGFTATDFPTHRKFRDIIPLTLAKFGWRTGYLDMFPEESKDLVLSNERGIKCISAVHCHQDESKIARYHAEFAHESEDYFTDPAEAVSWILD